MTTNYRKNINIKNNLISLSVFLIAALTSVLLIMTAINMLDVPKANKNRKDNQTASSDNLNPESEEPRESVEEPMISSEYWDRGEEWREKAKNRLEEKKKSRQFDGEFGKGEGPGSSVPYSGSFGAGIPENIPNIDISGNKNIPDIPFGSKNPGNTISLGSERRPHLPVFEILGKPNYSFLKVMVMDNYYGNRWVASQEKPEVRLMLNVDMTKGLVDNSVKIKPLEPSKGHLPTLSGESEIKYHHSLLEYAKSGTYMSEVVIDDYYEVEYKNPPGEVMLINADVDATYTYNITVSEKLGELVERLIADSSSDYEAIKNTEKYLAENYILNNSIVKDYGDKDGIMSFLFEEKQGNTLDFMSAYTYILRAAGIPCRLAVGYKINKELPYQIVYLNQTYIYPEIKFKNYGWVPMESMDRIFGYDPSFKPSVDTVTKIKSMDPEAKRGTGFTVKGTTKDIKGNPLNDMPVLIYVKKDKNEPVLSYGKTTVKNGEFSSQLSLTDDTGAGRYQVVADLLENDTYITSSSDPELKVTTDTLIQLDSPDSIVGRNFKVSGKLLDSYSGEVIGEKLVLSLSFEHDMMNEKLEIDNTGSFSKTIQVGDTGKVRKDKDFFFVRRFPLVYKVSFEGTDIFYSSSTSQNLFVWELLWLRIAVTLAVIFLIITIIIVRTWKNRKIQVTLQNELSETVSAEKPIILEYDYKDKGVFTSAAGTKRLSIAFPQIKDGLPLTWGVMEELAVRFVDIYGYASEVNAVFQHKGTYRIRFKGNGDEVSSTVSIVDYREEVIYQGKMFIQRISDEDNSINAIMTLREIYEVVEPKIPSDRHGILGEVFEILEKAVYSDVNILREDYEKLYLGIRKL